MYVQLQDTLYIRIPKQGGTEDKHFEPLSVVFLVFLAMIILIQFVSMLFHRYGTFLHILASTGLHCCSKQYEPVGVEDIVQTVKVGCSSLYSVIYGHAHNWSADIELYRPCVTGTVVENRNWVPEKLAMRKQGQKGRHGVEFLERGNKPSPPVWGSA